MAHQTKRSMCKIKKHKHHQRQKHKQHRLPKPHPDVRPVKHNKGEHIDHLNETNVKTAAQEFKEGLLVLAVGACVECPMWNGAMIKINRVFSQNSL